MKTVRIVAVALLFLCLALVFASCGDVVSFKLIFIVDGEVYSTADTAGNASVVLPEDPIKEGDEFDGWYWDRGTWQRPFTADSLMNASLSADISVYAKWKSDAANDGQAETPDDTDSDSSVTFTVTFDPNGGTAVDAQTVKEGKRIQAPADPTRPGYVFAGWDADLTAPVTGDLTVKAAWTPATNTPYAVEYYLQNAARTGYEKTETDPMTGTTATKVTATQKTFPHFSYNVARSTAAGTVAADGSLVLRMYYNREQYTVTFAGNGGTLKSGNATQTVYYGNAAVPPTFTRNGYNFTGWNNVAGISSVDRNMTVTAQWQAVSYTVTYELDGGTNAAANPATYTIESTVTLAAPTRGEDNFAGWYLPNGQKVKKLTGLTGNLTLTARWGNLDKWETFGDSLSDLDASDRALTIELSAYGDAEKASRNDLFLAGPDSIDGSTPNLQKLIYQRNTAANLALGTTVEYVYWDDLGWGSQMNRIFTLTQSFDASAPDLFVNMIYDLSNATLQGCFKDIWSIPCSYFDFHTEGWMTEWMESMSFSGDRAYILGGDYFLDLYRALLVLPFNMDLMDANAARLAPAIGISLGEGETLSGRFFDLVEAGNWTYEKLGLLCNAIWLDSDNDLETSASDLLGMMVDGYGGTAASAFIYSAGLTLTDTCVNGNGKQWIVYPSYPGPLEALFDAVTDVFAHDGVLVTKNSSITVSAHNVKFANDGVLFAGPRMLGGLDDDDFQTMTSRYSVVPFPKVNASDDYHTVIHNVGDAGAINANVTPLKARVLSAYLQYCAENSGEIKNEFLNRYTKYSTFEYTNGTGRMLDLIYASISSNGRDKAVEDLMNTSATKALRWHALMKDKKNAPFRTTGSELNALYDSGAVYAKQTRLDDLLETWYTLPKEGPVE